MEYDKIIFLDFDGVMDTEFYDLQLCNNGIPNTDENGPIFDPACVNNLKYIIESTGAKIVISSTWKYFMSYEKLLKMWKARKLPGIVVDVTPDINNHRGDEIDAWLNKNSTKQYKYVIIDDLGAGDFNEHQINKLVLVNPYNGLDEMSANRAISILEK